MLNCRFCCIQTCLLCLIIARETHSLCFASLHAVLASVVWAEWLVALLHCTVLVMLCIHLMCWTQPALAGPGQTAPAFGLVFHACLTCWRLAADLIHPRHPCSASRACLLCWQRAPALPACASEHNTFALPRLAVAGHCCSLELLYLVLPGLSKAHGAAP